MNQPRINKLLEARVGIEPTNKGFADLYFERESSLKSAGRSAVVVQSDGNLTGSVRKLCANRPMDPLRVAFCQACQQNRLLVDDSSGIFRCPLCQTVIGTNPELLSDIGIIDGIDCFLRSKSTEMLAAALDEQLQEGKSVREALAAIVIKETK